MIGATDGIPAGNPVDWLNYVPVLELRFWPAQYQGSGRD